MRDIVIGLCDEVRRYDPDLVLFFATGAIPYVLPLLNRLGHKEFERSPDCPRFHLFPGLSWDGAVGQLTSDVLFRAELLRLLQGLALDRRARVLCIDTTNTGNAVNKILKETRAVSGLFSREVDLRVIGIVNAAQAVVRASDIVQVRYGVCKVAQLLPPSAWQMRRTLADREFLEIFPAGSSSLTRFHISYWLQDVFTEDVPELIGAAHLHSELAVRPGCSAGRLEIVFSSGSMLMSSTGTVSDQLSTLISADDGSVLWTQLSANEAASSEHAGHDLDPVISEVLQTLEIDGTVDAEQKILKKKSLLTAAEVRALYEAEVFDETASRKVKAAQQWNIADELLQVECVVYFDRRRKRGLAE